MEQVTNIPSLIELALKHGISYQELMQQVKDLVLITYFRNYAQADRDAEVVIDSVSGQIRLMSSGKEVTPGDFGPLVDNKITGLILEQIKGRPEAATGLFSDVEKWVRRLAPLVLFWGYNLIYALIGIIVLTGLFKADYRREVWQLITEMDWFQRSVAAYILTVPLACMVLAVLKKTTDLKKVFFGFEAPTFILGLIILSIFANPVPAVAFFGWMILSLPLAANIKGLGSDLKNWHPWITALDMGAGQIYFMVLFYLSVLWSFLLPVIVAMPLKGLVELLFGNFRRGTGEVLTVLIWALVWAIPLALLLGLPYLLTVAAGRYWQKARAAMADYAGSSIARNWTYCFGLIFTAVLLALAYQPDYQKTFDKLNQAVTGNFEEKERIARELTGKQTTIKQMILDAQEFNGRYPLSSQDSFLANWYEQVLEMPKTVSSVIDSTFKVTAFPIVYRRDFQNYQELDQYYRYLFGVSIYDSGRRDEEKMVELKQRRVDVKTDYNGLLAEVSIDDEYENRSTRSEEVIYEFSLPDGSAVHELKLGPNLEYDGVIAPKGAAAATYQREVDRSLDPALLEQTGPRQYRLRVFPVPGKNDTFTLKGRQRVKFTYTVAADNSGYGLPVYSRLTNLEANNRLKIEATVNGERTNLKWNDRVISTGETKKLSDLLCQSVDPVGLKTTVGGLNVELLPHKASQEFVCDKQGEPQMTGELKGQNIALLLDVSYGNKDTKQYKELETVLRNNPELTRNNRVDLYRFNDSLSQPLTLDESSLSQVGMATFFGSGNLVKSLKGLNQSYDLAVVLTGDKIEEYSRANLYDYQMISDEAPQQIEYPVYLIHGPTIPAYKQKLSEFITSGGGMVVDNFADAVNHFAFSRRTPGQNVYIGKYWSLNITEADETLGEENRTDSLKNLAARKLIDAKIREAGMARLMETATLDQLHARALKYMVTSYYSSLIALVNDQQRQALEQNSQNWNKYEEMAVPETRRWSGGVMNPIGPFGVSTFNMSIPSMQSDTIEIKPNSSLWQPLSSPSLLNMGSSGLPIIVIAVGGVMAVGSAIYFLPMLLKRKK